MATITWGSSTGLWATVGNWVGGLVPSATDIAVINAGTASNTSAVAVQTLQLNNSATLNSNANLAVGLSILLGNGGFGTSSLNISGGTTSAGTFVNIGISAGNAGAVNVSSGGILQAPQITVGLGAAGILTVSGGTVNASSGITVGNSAATGSVIFGGASVAAASGTINGNIALSNAGSSLLFHTTDTAAYTGNLSGVGSVTVNSVGQSAILSGTNTHSGATTIMAGTLQIGNGGTAGSLGTGAVNIAAGATLAFQHGDGQYVNANAISGSGNVIQRGSFGSLEVLTANNTYSGTTTINGGVLAIGYYNTTGTLGTGNVIFENNGALDLVRSDTQLIANNILGAGAVRLYGNHTAILTGANSYSGGSEIFGTSTLQIGNGGTTGTLGTGNVTIEAGSSLAFQHADGVYVNASVISGAGNVIRLGSFGSLEVLTANNTYTGTTTINGGVLAIGYYNTTGTLGTGNVIFENNGALDLVRSDTQLIANNILGAGAVRLYGNHTAILTGANSYSGRTIINAGSNTLQVGDSGTTGSLGSSEVTIGAGSTLAFQHAAGLYVNANVISGSGNVLQRGATNSVEVLTGNNSYTGSTYIDGGTLSLSGTGSIANSNAVFLNLATSRLDISNISGSSAYIIDLLSYSGSDGAQVILGGKTLNVTATLDNVGRISFVGSAGTDAVVFNLRAGTNDGYTLTGLAEATFANWTDGVDSITINGNTGANILTGDELRATIINGGDGMDIISGGAGNDTLKGDAGNDTIIGGSGSDSLNGGADIDTASYASNSGAIYADLGGNYVGEYAVTTGTVTGAEARLSLDTVASIENIIGTAFGDRIYGSGVDNIISGGAGADVIYGEGGNDRIAGGVGADVLLGGAGVDTVDYATAQGSIYLDINAGFALETALQTGTVLASTAIVTTDLMAQFENAVGSDYGDRIYGNALDNLILGGAGDDIIYAEDGNDIVIGGTGSDILLGGNGTDTLDYSSAAGAIFSDLNSGFTNETALVAGTVNAGTALIGFDLHAQFENLIGSGFGDRLYGTAGVNTITGNGGDDFIYGGGGNDIISGGDGNDRLIGEAGADTLTGGAGADLFFATTLLAGEVDTITDFATGSDQLYINRAAFGLGSTPTATLVVNGSASVAGTFLYNSSTGFLSFDSDGAGGAAAVNFANIGTGLGLTVADIVLYG
jgi:autotransporter-associated beta strand protein